ncbi:LysR family transcriptional regulator [Luteibacter aegosomaticola]|uniref:LysR family transcriptional regulator n=1 Tax=Luteibacter aegosomaticola TaxID=2911538 RepID=UPI001FF94693|nr:LysR family transcriptional regulator [Luteibacter aegosomaticola]UPG88144.1 LysR family transcriptional regulator [Luteibacter aegosomaticola]
MNLDLNLLQAFVAVAETGNFRAAADRLGVTRSAVSQAMRRLEDQLSVALARRTTRSVSLTEAGARLYADVAPNLAELAASMEATGSLAGMARGQLRLAVSTIAERFLDGPLLAAFMLANPGIELDVTVTDEEFDIVAEGYDAGVRLGEVIEQDMIAIPVSGPMRQVAVASPDYLERHAAPAHPRDLTAHRCIGWRPAPHVAPYRWEFEADGEPFDVAAGVGMTTNDVWLMLRTALAGGGITFGTEDTFRPYIDRGELVSLLEPWLTPFPGFFLYYPGRRHLAPKLRALVDHVKAFPQPSR